MTPKQREENERFMRGIEALLKIANHQAILSVVQSVTSAAVEYAAAKQQHAEAIRCAEDAARLAAEQRRIFDERMGRGA